MSEMRNDKDLSEDREIMSELSKAESERMIIREELNADMRAFADDILSGMGEQIKELSGKPNKIIKKSWFDRLKQWARKVTG